MDAEYEIRPRLTRDLNESVPLYTEAQLLEVSIDGERVGDVHAAGRRRRAAAAQPPARSRRRDAPPSRPSPSTARQPARPAISQIQQTVRVTAKRARGAQPRRRDVEPARAGEGRAARRRRSRSSTARRRSTRRARLPFQRPYPGRREHSRDAAAARTCGAWRSSGRSIRPGRASRTEPHAHLHVPPSTAGSDATRARGRSCRRWRAARIGARSPAPMSSRCWRSIARARRRAASTTGIERALRRLLVSPEFLFRVERDPAGAAPGAPYRISDVELASRLSFFLWSSIPDDELLDARRARAAARRRPCSSAQVRRMLADPRADAFVTQLRRAVAVPAQPRRRRCRCRASSRTSTTACARRSAARPSCSSRASCARIAARSICCAPTTRSSTSGWRSTTAFRT